MSYEVKNNTGTLFANDRKETPSHPDYTGQAVIDGADYWLSAWKKQSQAGKTYLSFSFKPKEARNGSLTGNFSQQAALRGSAFDDDSDTPF